MEGYNLSIMIFCFVRFANKRHTDTMIAAELCKYLVFLHNPLNKREREREGGGGFF